MVYAGGDMLRTKLESVVNPAGSSKRVPPEFVDRWAEVLDFNPHSGDQVLDLIRHRKLPVKYDRKTKKPTSGEDALDAICKQKQLPPDDPLRQIIRCRKISKALGYLYDTFLGADGRLHPEYTQLPDTGRLSSRSPNIQNQPQGRGDDIQSELALAIRRTIVPSPSHTLIEVDWRGLQAVLVAYFAGDPDYGRICEIDVHSYLASIKVGQPADLSWDDAKLTAYLKDIKNRYPVERHMCKTGNHADAFDIQIPHLAEVLGSKEEAKAFKELRAAAFPKIKRWQIATRLRAHTEGKLQTPFGNLRYFWNVYAPNKDGVMDYGAEAWEALSFLPQGTEAGMLKEVMLALSTLPGYGVRYHLLAPIHDSLLLEAEYGAEEECINNIRGLMETKWPQLDGLSIKTDYKTGRNWAEL
jgi:DNA polymerase-1